MVKFNFDIRKRLHVLLKNNNMRRFIVSKLTKQEIVDSVPQKGLFGHPKGLFTLFFS